jgi:hypothetical protein
MDVLDYTKHIMIPPSPHNTRPPRVSVRTLAPIQTLRHRPVRRQHVLFILAVLVPECGGSKTRGVSMLKAFNRLPSFPTFTMPPDLNRILMRALRALSYQLCLVARCPPTQDNLTHLILNALEIDSYCSSPCLYGDGDQSQIEPFWPWSVLLYMKVLEVGGGTGAIRRRPLPPRLGSVAKLWCLSAL